MRTCLAATVLVALCVTGCGSSASDDESAAETTPAASVSTTEPETTDVVVTITDSVPLEVLNHAKANICTTRSYAEIVDRVMAGEKDPDLTPVVITLKDASGTIIDQQTLEDFGGNWAQKTCTWSVTFEDEPAGDFFSATVTGYQFEEETSGSAAAGLEFRL